MTTTIRNITLVGGSGRLGSTILSALQKSPQFDVTVVTRFTSTAIFPPSTKVIKVKDDYPVGEMVAVFRGQDAVVLSIGFGPWSERSHSSLVEASIQAGVKRLIASTFDAGVNDEAQKIFPVAETKARIVEELKRNEASGWSWTAIQCGLCFEFCIRYNFFQINAANRTARVMGDGNTKFSCTSLKTIGTAVGSVLKNLDQTVNRRVYISNFETSANEILKAYGKAVGVDEWNVTNFDADEAIDDAKKQLLLSSENLVAMGTLGLAIVVKPGLGGDFKAEGLLDNDLLEIPTLKVDQVVTSILKAESKVTKCSEITGTQG
ncbi:NAD(P)-binding protein [Glonium stellatum]|uniref:NAD(P)-binding protein n=1 Tax=Glonium stellatum TaxID=574774 RepID=A0A8E2EXA4_9PEZI|nr:NAD(P)-binding protein [Glonium stellatum]